MSFSHFSGIKAPGISALECARSRLRLHATPQIRKVTTRELSSTSMLTAVNVVPDQDAHLSDKLGLTPNIKSTYIGSSAHDIFSHSASRM